METSIKKTFFYSRAPVAHACNPSYSRGRDQEDHSSKPAQVKSSQEPISKNPSQSMAGEVAQGEGPEFKPQYHTQKRQLKKNY
jgi:hypothetical protein